MTHGNKFRRVTEPPHKHNDSLKDAIAEHCNNSGIKVITSEYFSFNRFDIYMLTRLEFKIIQICLVVLSVEQKKNDVGSVDPHCK